jgi:hypothetical protein
MCTVTFIARQNGYCLGMNRDEKLTRPQGTSPQIKKVNGRAVLAPSEPGGGTWIAVNDHGVTFAIINWYSIKAQVDGEAVSRGKVIASLGAAASSKVANAALCELMLQRMHPFRLIGVFPRNGEIVEWRWNLNRLASIQHAWKPQQWISSGFDEPAAERLRSRTFRRAARQKSPGSADWLRRLHRSHAPHDGPFSTCMHRADAATVSFTEVTVRSRLATMQYHAGPPCQRPSVFPHVLAIT